MPCDYRMPLDLDVSANIGNDLKTIPDAIVKTTVPSGITYGITGDNTNIYTVILNGAWGTAGATSLNLSATTDASNNVTVSIGTQVIDASGIISKFNGTAVSDDVIESILTYYGFAPLTNISATSSDVIQTAITNFNTRVNFTYCAYEKLYKSALTNYFSNTTSVDNKKKVIVLNIKLNIINSGLDRIRRYFQSKSTSIMADTNQNTNITAINTSLATQLEQLTSTDSDRVLYARMVEYTEEKNQAHRNLLGMYTVLNLVALGLIFYISRG